MPNTERIDQYAVIGNPVAHSKSPFLHSAFSRQCHQSMHYRALLAPLDQFEKTLREFIAGGAKGANVTLPFKLEAFQLCSALTPRAEAAGAVNTLGFEGNEIYGDNTDGCGLVRDIVNNAGVALKDRRILLLGAGGAARGALLPLLECLPQELVIANRSAEKAQQLAKEFKRHGPVHAAEFEQLHGEFDVVINATSASISAQRPPVSGALYKPGALAYDMMYGADPTPFLEHAAQYQAKTRDGWGMLVEQAAEAFYVWRGVRPHTAELLIRENLTVG